MKLTIGMAVYDDYDGAYFSIQALRLYQDLRDTEILVIDNKPDSPGSTTLKNQIEGMFQPYTAGARYIPAPNVVGTSAPRNLVFQEAAGDFVVCMDSHVMLQPSAVQELLKWCERNPESNDLITGPLLYDNLQQISTHFQNIWRGEMWGVWASAWETCPGGDKFQVHEGPNKEAVYTALGVENIPLSSSVSCNITYPKIPYNGHWQILLSLGCRPLGFDSKDEFEIPAQGLGLFGCHKSAWPEFNPYFRGFGGEEYYIHEKFRQRGNKCLCLGFLKWLHRFARPGGVKFPLNRWDRVRNYVLGHLELGLPLDAVKEHFLDGKLITQEDWDIITADPVHCKQPKGVIRTDILPETVEGIYEYVRSRPRDLDKHFPKFKELASQCNHVTEFSKRRESFVALAAGLPETFVSFNTEASDPVVQHLLTKLPNVRLEDKVSSELTQLESTDLLFIDSTHTQATLERELRLFAPSVKRWIVLHDTALHANQGEDGGPGLLAAIKSFFETNPNWFVYYHTNDQYGLTVLGCRLADKPAKPIHLWPLGFGPGTELKALWVHLGIVPGSQCQCNQYAIQMDFWEVQGCKDNRDTIIKWLRDGQDKWGWKDKLVAAAKAVKTGLAFKISWVDPFPDLVDEAIRRAEDKEFKDVG